MRILITGGAGFIGSHSAQVAQAAGHAVRVLDNLSTGLPENVPAGVELVAGDIRDAATVAAAVDGCDAILHLAAVVSVPLSLREPVETFNVNTAGTLLLLDAARRAGLRRFVLASTCAVYGDLPGRKDEESPVCPLTPYAAAKLAAEEWVQTYARAYGLQTVILRYFNVYGPRQRADSPYSGVIARWCTAAAAGQACRIFGDGAQTRDFVSVHDVAAANLLALERQEMDWGGIYPVASGVTSSLNDVLAALERAAGSEIKRSYEPPRAGDIVHSSGSGAHLQALGWRAATSLEDGLRELLRSAS